MGDSGPSCAKSVLVIKETKIVTAREIHERLSSDPSAGTNGRGHKDD